MGLLPCCWKIVTEGVCLKLNFSDVDNRKIKNSINDTAKALAFAVKNDMSWKTNDMHNTVGSHCIVQGKTM